MKKVAIVLAILALVGLAQVSQAANLQAGWFVNIYGVGIGQYNDPNPPSMIGWAQFLTEPGEYTPFAVTDGGYDTDTMRYISVAHDTVASSDQSLILPLYMPVAWHNNEGFFNISWGTNYNSSQMRLEFWHETQNGVQSRIWEQSLSGTRYAGVDLYQDNITSGNYFFKVSIVPEPSSIVSLVSVLPLLIGFAKRRK